MLAMYCGAVRQMQSVLNILHYAYSVHYLSSVHTVCSALLPHCAVPLQYHNV